MTGRRALARLARRNEKHPDAYGLIFAETSRNMIAMQGAQGLFFRRQSTQSIGAILLVLCATGCAYDDEPDFGSVSEPITLEMSSDDRVDDYTGPNNAAERIGNLVYEFDLTAGDAVYVAMRADVTSTSSANMLDKIWLRCHPTIGSDTAVKTTTNHVGTGIVSYRTRMLFRADPSTAVPPPQRHVSCDVKAAVYPPDYHDNEPSGESHTYKAGANTYLQVSPAIDGPDPFGDPGRFARWGTENDNTYGDRCSKETNETRDCTYIGNDPDLGANSEEYILRSPRFSVSPGYAYLTVDSEIEMTTCWDGTRSCIDAAYGHPFYKGAGSQVDLRIIVEQMCSATSSTVGKTTYYPPTGPHAFDITSNEHHEKASLQVDVPIVTTCPNCSGGVCADRNFKIKTLVENESMNPVKIEYGDQGSGYSTSFAFANN